MLEWTIDREGEGPMKAFKNLGQYLANQIPRTANSMLEDMCSSILRSQISNSTIGDVIKNRHELREKILKEMSEVTKGWGVHLETVEVTDVRILSGTLFSNMQTKFRE
jgi:regulator of protease activity HflC (stomatin/prohibitin superfamily)